MMKKIIIDLENCYSIGELKHEFDFSKDKAYSIYAANGLMKTSLSKTFSDLSSQKKPKDIIHPDRESKSEVNDENGAIKAHQTELAEKDSAMSALLSDLIIKSQEHDQNIEELLSKQSKKK